MKVTYLNDRVRRMELSRPSSHNMPILVITRSGVDKNSPRNQAKIRQAEQDGATLVVLEPDDGEAA